MKVWILLVLAPLVAGGCGQAGTAPEGPPEGAPAGSVPVETQPEPPTAATRPPDVLLVSRAGTQVGVVGSFCVDSPETYVGTCSDGLRPEAEQVSVVRPGETVTIALDRARAVRAQGCFSRDTSCVGEASVVPLGCRSTAIAGFSLDRAPETDWTVNLDPGAYELQVYVYFRAEDGRAGDVSVALGLLVDSGEEPAVVQAPAVAAVCP